MARNGILIDYKYCSGCHTCEVACQKEHGLSVGQWGIKVQQNGPWQIKGTKKWVYDYVPTPTDLCTLCVKRTSAGKLPTCVQHCWTGCMKFGPLEELVKEMGNKSKQVLFAPR
jgi:anaerobic dimethyl sulfoxide reductase subunit B (iron-sulfur subunit)